jgi:hypothetical protein
VNLSLPDAGHANYRITLDMYVGTTPASPTAPAPQPDNPHQAAERADKLVIPGTAGRGSGGGARSLNGREHWNLLEHAGS